MKLLKKIFLVAAMFVIATLFFFGIKEKKQDTIIAGYPMVWAIQDTSSSGKALDKASFETKLDNFAKENKSLVLRQIVVTAGGGSALFYQPYGVGKFPANIPLASKQQASDSSLLTQYKIVQGTLSKESLQNFISQNSSFIVQSFPAQTLIFRALVMINASTLSVLSYTIIFIAFLIFAIYLQVSELRRSAISLISGVKVFRFTFRC